MLFCVHCICYRFGNLQNAFFSPQDQNDSWYVELELPLTYATVRNNGYIIILDIIQEQASGAGLCTVTGSSETSVGDLHTRLQ